MRMTCLALAAALTAQAAQANEVFGVWQSEKTDDGKYLHIEMHPCRDDDSKVCGTVADALGGADAGTIGKRIIWDMVPDGPGEWQDGKIWKADEDEVYDSEMALEGGNLVVSGCVLGGLICRSQTWPRVE